MILDKVTFIQPFDILATLYLCILFIAIAVFIYNNLKVKDELNFLLYFNLFIVLLSFFLFFLTRYEFFYLEKRVHFYLITLIVVIYILLTQKIKFIKKIKKLKPDYFVIIFLLGYFLLSLGPPTDADSLDYHLGYPINILLENKVILRNDWLHLQLAGLGEMMTLLGMIFGSKNFGQIINFIALLNIFLLLSFLKKKYNSSLEIKYYIFSTPLLLWLVYSSKPQLYQTSLILIIITFFYNYLCEKKFIVSEFLILAVFSIFTTISKISFIIVILSINITFVIYLFKSRHLFLFLFINLLALFFFFVPIAFYNLDIYNNILPPFSEILKKNPDAVIIKFLDTLKNDNATFISFSKFYHYLFFPFFFTLTNNFSFITATLGLGLITIYYVLYLLLRKINLLKFFFLILLISITSFFIVIPNMQPRYFLDIYFINCIVLLVFCKNSKFIKTINYILKYQSYAVMIGVFFSVFLFTKGSFTKSLFNSVMLNHANNYNQALWINENIFPKDAVTLNEHMRSNIFLNKFISRERYFKFDSENLPNNLKMIKFDYITLKYPILNESLLKFVEECTDYHNIKNIKEFFSETRNPYSKIRDIKYKLILLKNIC